MQDQEQLSKTMEALSNWTPDVIAKQKAAIEDALKQAVSVHPSRLTVKLVSAKPLTSKDREDILAPIYERKLPQDVQVIVDSKLLNGYILTINDIELDYSLRTSIAKLAMDLFSKNEILKWKDYASPSLAETGVVLSTADGIARIDGLDHCINGELLQFGDKPLFEEGENRYGIAMNLERDFVGVMLLCDSGLVKAGDTCKRSGRTVSVPTGEALLGRVVNPLGYPIDGKGKFDGEINYRPIEASAPTIIDRSSVNEPLYTGITAIDAMMPIGRGQRELIIGDRQTGKTTIAVDTIINQKGKGVHCIYVAIGQKMSTVANIVALLEKYDAMEYTTVVLASASDTAGLQYVAPYAGCAMAEELMYQGKDVLIIYDDLTRHAQAYRTISLLLRRPPGREAFPGDVFYIHSRLLERAAKLTKELGGGSITALPIVETQAGDISAYVPTNVISITDGQIYLETGLFFAGQRPAINVGLSVSRVGGAAQCKGMRKVAGPLRINLAQFREKQAFAQFGSDVDKETRLQLERGQRLYELLRQSPEELRTMADSVAILILANENGFADVNVEDIRSLTSAFISDLHKNETALMDEIAQGNAVSEEVKNNLKNALNHFKKTWVRG